MEIGGVDLILEGATSNDDWIAIFHEVCDQWPSAIFSRIDSGEAIVFKDEGAFRVGKINELPEGAYFCIIVRPEDFTVVVEEGENESSRVGRAVLEAVRAARETPPEDD